MSELLEIVCASAPAGSLVIDTLELNSPAWPAPVRLVNNYDDLSLGIESGEVVTFTAAPMSITLPKRDNSPRQTLRFAIDNVTGESQRLLDLALEAGERVNVVFRRYLDSDRTMPSERAFTSSVLGGGMESRTVQIEAGFMNLLDWRFPRNSYTLAFAPQLAYL